MPFDADLIAARTRHAVHELSALEWITDSRVTRLSQDFNWFSPVLARQLEGLRADAVVRPRDEAEVAAVLSHCARHGLPVTVRGSGTGNYGQCVPLHGGVVLDLSAMRQLLWHRGGVARAQAGIRLGDLDAQTRVSGWELRCVPSTFRSATLGGLFGGGFGGVGSINHGPLAAPGNVLGVRAISLEPQPRLVELRAPEALLLHHLYGSNGIVLELEVALAPVHPWRELVVCFERFEPAIAWADEVAQAPGLVKKSVTLLSEAVVDLLRQGAPWLADSLQPGRPAVLLLVAESAAAPLRALAHAAGGRVTMDRDADEVAASHRTLVECTWNHTTLHALRADRTLTYLQTALQPGRQIEQAQALRAAFGDEVPLHLEWIRGRDGRMGCSGLPLVRFTSEERLDEIMRRHRELGVVVNNPHVFVVEDGKQAAIDPAALAMKARLDPGGLLNPGKLRTWDQRHPALPQAA